MVLVVVVVVPVLGKALVLELVLVRAAALEWVGGKALRPAGTALLHNQGHEHLRNTHHLIGKTSLMGYMETNQQPGILQEIPQEAEVLGVAAVAGELVEGLHLHQAHTR